MIKKIIAVILSAVTISAFFTACDSNNKEPVVTTAVSQTAKITDNSSFKLSYTQADSLDPFKSKTQNNQVLASLVFESLFDLDEQYEPIPNIATGYEYTNQTTLKININPNIKFSDGSILDCDDIIYSINAAKKSPGYGSSLTSISYAEKGDGCIFIHLKSPNPTAVNLLTFPIASEEDDENGYPVGSGRYSYKTVGKKTALKANISERFDPYITTINLVNIASEDSIDNAVNIGNISYAFRDLSADVSKRMSCAKKVVNMNNLVYIGVNSMAGITSNSHIRRAISLAADRTILAESAYAGYASPALSIFNPSCQLAKSAGIFSKNADISAAKQEIAMSEYAPDKLNLSILVNENANKIAAANLLKPQLEAAGFKVKIYKEKNSEYKRKIKNIEFDIYIGEVKLSDDMSLSPFFDKKGGVRYGINNKALSVDGHYKKYLDGSENLGKFILSFNEEVPYIPLLYKKGMICYSKAMNGDMQGYYGNFFSNIESWNYMS